MTKKNKQVSQRTKSLEKQIAALRLANKKIRKSTPFRDTGGIIGGAAGSLFGNKNIGNSIGKWLGTGIGSIFGSGDYVTVGQSSKYNVLQGNTPKFSSTHATNIVCHREYIEDITGTTAFTNRSYPLNPGVSTAFPWLQGIAANYQQYKIHGMVFEFRPLITDFVTSGAPGVVVMATNYNADNPVYASKQEMENSEFAVSVKPTLLLQHLIECDPGQTPISELYVRSGDLPTEDDLRLFDLGTFQLATQGNPNQLLGELWVTYCVEFYKPVLSLTNLTTEAVSAHIIRAAVTNANPIGTINVSSSGALAVTCTGTTITVTGAVVGVAYFMEQVFTCINPATNSMAIPTLTGANGLTWNAELGVPDVATSVQTTGTFSTRSMSTQYVRATDTTMVFTYSGAYTYGTGSPSLEIFISSVDQHVTG